MAEKSSIPDEEIAYRIVKLYFEEIARLGFKRKLDLDAIINAYFYALSRLQAKERGMQAISRLVKKQEAELATETREELFPEVEGTKIEMPSKEANK